MLLPIRRRDFLKISVALAAAGLVGPLAKAEDKKPLFEISLAEWSLHRTIKEGKLDNLDFAKAAKHDYGINAIEFVNQFFKDKAKNTEYLTELKKRADGEGVKMLLIMCDGEGALGDADEKKRQMAVENHFQWVEAAMFLGCHSIRVNAQSSGSYDEQVDRAADGLRKLTEFGAKHEINVIVENHGGLSSNGEWLAKVMKQVDHKRCGTLPDFGNFALNKEKTEWYDRYKGVTELMPFAKAVSAKSYDFEESKPLTTIDTRTDKETDFLKMMKIVLAAGYHGYVGIEYEGTKVGEPEGIRATKKLLERVLAELSKA
ncbi:MAG: TIM barrel protein [Planctomycetaceae bacterium]|nr:TIM barrel protein [Planctomycetaceae bacterium]